MQHIHSYPTQDLYNKTVLIRVDWNVPCNHQGKILDHTRIKHTIDTIHYLHQHGAKIIIITHFGRPTIAQQMRKSGNTDPLLYCHEETFSIKPLIPDIEVTIKHPLTYIKNPFEIDFNAYIQSIQPGTCVITENIRFFAGEEENNHDFARALCSFADIYVNDAFSCSHRAHASVDACPRYLPHYAGTGLHNEISFLSKALEHPKRPVWGIIGGAKVSTKIDLLVNLSQKLDGIIIGGAMANTFLKAKGYSVGTSRIEPDYIDTARHILEQAHAKIILPVDGYCAERLDFEHDVPVTLYDYSHIPDHLSVFDIGDRTRAHIKECIEHVPTIIWNGPVGVSEHPVFAQGSHAIAHTLAHLTKNSNTLTIAGGGDTLAVLTQTGCTDKISFCSTAGGAFLEYLEGKSLPGIKALML